MTAPAPRSPAPVPPCVDAPQPAPSELGALTRLAAPLLLSSLLTLVMLVTDRMWVGSLGSEALAGLGVAQATLVLLTTVFLGLGMGTLAGVARETGAARPRAAATTLGAGLWLAAAIGLALGASGLVLPRWILHLHGLDPAVGVASAGYLQITLAGTLAQGPLLVVLFALQGAGSGRAALTVGAVAPLVNVLLDPLGVLWLGLDGAAWVTALANLLAFAVALRVLRSQRRLLPLSLAHVRPNARALRGILGVGVPGSCEHLVRNGAGLALVLLIAPWGAEVIAGYTAGLAVLLLLVHPGLAVGQATASLVGQALGADDRPRARRVAWTGAALGAGLLGLGGLVVWRWAPALVSIFDASPRAISAGTGFLRTVALVLPGLGASLALGKALHAARRSWWVLGVAAGAHLAVQLPLVWLLSTRYGPGGAWLGMATAFLVQAVLLARVVGVALGEPRPTRIPWRLPLRRVTAAALVLCLATLGGCQTVDFTEKRHLADPIMVMDDGPAHVHWQQKVHYSREGSAGGIGQSGGGGCGCY